VCLDILEQAEKHTGHSIIQIQTATVGTLSRTVKNSARHKELFSIQQTVFLHSNCLSYGITLKHNGYFVLVRYHYCVSNSSQRKSLIGRNQLSKLPETLRGSLRSGRIWHFLSGGRAENFLRRSVRQNSRCRGAGAVSVHIKIIVGTVSLAR
jgi:hypothetical protein